MTQLEQLQQLEINGKSQEEYFGGETVALRVTPDKCNYADMIMEAAVCEGVLLGKITQMNFDVNAGQGGVVIVPMIAAHTAQGPFTTCGCLSAASSTFTTATVTVGRWGDYEVMCEYSIWKAIPLVKSAIINEMGRAIAARFDTYLWSSLTAQAILAGYHCHTTVSCTSTATHATCCHYYYDLYNSIVSVKARMQGTGRNPDTIIMHPQVAVWLKKAYTKTMEAFVTFDANGNLTAVDGMRAFITCSAEPCAQTNNGAPSVMAVIIDSKRAIAEAWGKRPTFEEVRDPHCDSYQEVVWAYWGAHTVDVGAIYGIVNP